MDSDEWRLHSLRLTNMRCFTDVSLELSHLTVLVGRNGSGKSAILDSLASTLAPIVNELGGKETLGFADRDVRQEIKDLDSFDRVASSEPLYPIAASVVGVVAGRRFSWERRRNSKAGRTSPGSKEVRRHVSALAADSREFEFSSSARLPVIAHYGVERLVGVRRAHGKIGAARSDAYAAALDPRSDLTRLSGFIDGLQRQVGDAAAFGLRDPGAARTQFEAIDAACDRMLEGTGWARPRWNPIVDELTLTHPTHGTLPLNWLSTGIKITAGLAIDLASRMARANPNAGVDLLDRTPGVVLVDEIDLHLHPEWQQRIVPLLTSTFPRVQFILTTHSPQVLSTVAAKSVRILDQDRVVIPAYSEGLRSDVVLEEVQQTGSRPPLQVKSDLDRYMQMVNEGRGRSTEARTLRNRLEVKLGGSRQTPEFADADAIISLTDLDGDLGPDRPRTFER